MRAVNKRRCKEHRHQIRFSQSGGRYSAASLPAGKNRDFHSLLESWILNRPELFSSACCLRDHFVRTPELSFILPAERKCRPDTGGRQFHA
jgi:hypothetical protein